MLTNIQNIENSKENIQRGTLGRDIALSKIQELKLNFVSLGKNFKDEVKLVHDSVETDR